MKGSQGRNSRQELKISTETETMEGCGSLACSQWLAQPAFLHTYLGEAPPTVGWALPQQALIGGKYPIGLPTS